MAPSIIIFFFLLQLLTLTTSQSSLCRSSCGSIPVSYPFGLDPGCGSPGFHNLLTCTSTSLLLLRTPSGSYPVRRLSYSPDPHLVISDPSMWSCSSSSSSGARASHPPFALDTSTRLSLSPKNDFLFLNCSTDSVIVGPRPAICLRFPDRCDSSCDSSAYLCRNLPSCPERLGETSCCSYYPRASESVRMMLRHCAGGYVGLYWRSKDTGTGSYEDAAEYGVRVDFEVPVTTWCQQCRERGGGVCGYDVVGSKGFLCLCEEGNVTTYCGDRRATGHKTSAGVIAGTK